MSEKIVVPLVIGASAVPQYKKSNKHFVIDQFQFQSHLIQGEMDVTQSNQQIRVFFSDEKKFSIDRPSGWKSYLDGLCKEELCFIQRSTFSASEVSGLVILDEDISSDSLI